MERMVLDAVRGTPTALPSRTSHFQLKRRAQTPGPGSQSDSETESDPKGTASDQLGSSSDDTCDASFYEETDSATEMDLNRIPSSRPLHNLKSERFKRTRQVTSSKQDLK